jgi:copper chaperone
VTHIDLRIEGMTCNHCVMAVRNELQKLPGVNVNDVKIGSASIDVDETKVRKDQVHAAVHEAGYNVVSGQVTR